MSRITPYKWRSIDQLAAMLMKDNALELILGTDYELGPPETTDTDEHGCNTSVLFIPKIWDGAFEQQQFHYARLDLSALDKLPEGNVVAIKIQSFPFTTLSLISEINESLGLMLEPGEITDTTHHVGDLHYLLKINPDQSYAWLGERELVLDVSGRQHIRVPISKTVLGAVPNPQSYAGRDDTYCQQQDLLDLVKTTNVGETTIALATKDVIFLLPRVVDPTLNYGRNTIAQVSATDASVYYGAVEFQYNRRDLALLGSPVPLLSEVPFTQQILARHLNQFGAHLLDTDVCVPPVLNGLVPGDTGQLTIKTSDTSLIWNGEDTVPFVYGLPITIDALHTLVTDTLPSAGYLTHP